MHETVNECYGQAVAGRELSTFWAAERIFGYLRLTAEDLDSEIQTGRSL